MITSANPFLIHSQTNTKIQNLDSERWVFEVAENGLLAVDFLQFSKSLDATILLQGIGAKCVINCGYLLNKDNKININIHVIHQSKETASVENIRGLATDKAQVVFQGTITIPYDSQKCDGKQNHRGIVLSDSASISATPQLEIWADDVKCAHGSAVGPLDENQLFYLQTRGLDKSATRKLLLSSFFGDLMPEEFNPMIQEWMDENV